ncbi:MAG: hypothetical protein WC965_05920 [Thiohalomonadaceae bacterium]
MKWFFSVMLAANLGVFAWLWLANDHKTAADHITLQGALDTGIGLVLLEELAMPLPLRENNAKTKAMTTLAEASTMAQTVTAPIKAAIEVTGAELTRDINCVRIVGLETEKVATSVARLLTKSGAVIRQQGEESSTGARYWVYLPSAASASAAHATLQRLQQAKLKDIYLLKSGEKKHGVSLGVYSARYTAQHRVEQITAFKLQPLIEEIDVAIKQWWLEFDWPVEKGEASWREALPSDLKNIPAKTCMNAAILN